MTSYTMRYEVICHPIPINSPYLKTWGLTALCTQFSVHCAFSSQRIEQCSLDLEYLCTIHLKANVRNSNVRI